LSHFWERKCAQPCCREWKRRARSGKTVEVLSAGAALNARRSNKRSAESSVGAIQRSGAKRRTQLLISSGTFVWSGIFVTSWLRQLVGLSDRSLPDGGPCICAL